MLPRINACLVAVVIASSSVSAEAATFLKPLGHDATTIALRSAACDVHVHRRPGQIKATSFTIFVRNTGKLPLVAGTKLKVSASTVMLLNTITLNAELAPDDEVEAYTTQGRDAEPKNCTVTLL